MPNRAVTTMVFALIQVTSRFLAGHQRDLYLFTILIDNDRRRRLFTTPTTLDRKILKLANLAIISKNDGSGQIPLLKDGYKDRLQPFDTLGETLNNEIVAVAINDKARQKIRLRIDPAARQGVHAKAGAQFIGVFEPSSKERFVDARIPSREKPERDLGLGAVEGFSKNRVVFVSHSHDCAWSRFVDLKNVASIDPKMATANAGSSALTNAHLAFLHYWSHANLHARF